jgi:hypothetical protein
MHHAFNYQWNLPTLSANTERMGQPDILFYDVTAFLGRHDAFGEHGLDAVEGLAGTFFVLDEGEEGEGEVDVVGGVTGRTAADPSLRLPRDRVAITGPQACFAQDDSSWVG